MNLGKLYALFLGCTKLFSSELHKCYFLYIHKQIHSKVPTLLNFVGPKRPSGNCYVSCFLTDKTVSIWLRKWKCYLNASKNKNFSQMNSSNSQNESCMYLVCILYTNIHFECQILIHYIHCTLNQGPLETLLLTSWLDITRSVAILPQGLC